jgi:hypothetical protein
LSNEQIDALAFECIKFFIIKRFHARIDSWDKLMLLPERLLPVFEGNTRGRVSKLPHLQRLLIVKYCLNSKETYNITFPFLSEEEGDLTLNVGQGHRPLFLHVIDMPVYQVAQHRQPSIFENFFRNLGNAYRNGSS